MRDRSPIFIADKAIKPLNAKAYGSIGHLPASRVGPGDWHIHEGQYRICCEKPRKGDRIIVTEKIDGSCMAVARINGEIVPLTRSGYRAQDGHFEHLRRFAPYVESVKSQFDFLKEGERIAGEWTLMAIGTMYDISNPNFASFIAFDLLRGKERALRDEFVERVGGTEIIMAATVHDGTNACSIEDALNRLGPHGKHGAVETIEGTVWRVEREGRVDFLAKFVRLDKEDGKYLPEISGREPIWHIHD